MSNQLSRRSALKTAAAATLFGTVFAAVEENVSAAGLKGNMNHSVCKWCYRKIPLEKFCQESKRIGLKSVELLGPADFPMLKKYDLHCAMVGFPTVKAPDGKKVGESVTRSIGSSITTPCSRHMNLTSKPPPTLASAT